MRFVVVYNSLYSCQHSTSQLGVNRHPQTPTADSASGLELKLCWSLRGQDESDYGEAEACINENWKPS